MERKEGGSCMRILSSRTRTRTRCVRMRMVWVRRAAHVWFLGYGKQKLKWFARA